MSNIQVQKVNVKKVVVTSEELSKVNANIKCTEKGCFATFKSSSNLSMHLAKHHKIPKSKITLEKKEQYLEIQFHCPISSCKYSLNGGVPFKRSTLLKQHYLKVHAAKKFICEKCKKGFATQAIKNYHSQSCGINFVCSCGSSYISRDSLLTHARRKRHSITTQGVPSAKSCIDGRKSLAEAFPIHFLAAVALSELSKPITREMGIQTEEGQETRHKRKAISPARAIGSSLSKASLKRKASTHTQTLALKKLKTSTETQTTGDVILRKAMQNANIPTKSNKRNSKKHCVTQTSRKNPASTTKQIETQTQLFRYEKNSQTDDLEKSQDLQNELKNANLTEIETDISDTLDNNFIESQSLINNSVNLPDVWLNQKSTQTNPIESSYFSPFESFDTLLSDDKFQSCETQTELAEYGENFLDDCDTNFTLCSNIETQTCNELNESIEELLHSNMYTQTCDELLLDFVDIQTQTWPDNFTGDKDE